MTAPAFSPEQLAWMQQNGMLGQQQRPTVAPPNQFPQPFQQPAIQQPVQQPMQFGQVQQVPPAQQQPQNSVLNQRITAGPGVPAVLVGRTVQEAVEALTRMSGQLQQVQRGQPNPQSPQQGQQSQSPQAQAAAILNAGQQQQQTPAAITMEGIQAAMRQTIAEQQLPQVILQLEQSVAQTVPIYARDQNIRTRVQEIIGQLPPEQQALRGTWDYALSMAVGERALQQQQQGMPGFVAPTVPGNAAWNAPQQPQQQQPQFSDRALQLPQTFVEAPSNNSFASMNQRPPLTQVEAGMANKFGLDPLEVSKYNTENFGGFAQ